MYALVLTRTQLWFFFNDLDLTRTRTLETRAWTRTRGIVTRLQHCSVYCYGLLPPVDCFPRSGYVILLWLVVALTYCMQRQFERRFSSRPLDQPRSIDARRFAVESGSFHRIVEYSGSPLLFCFVREKSFHFLHKEFRFFVRTFVC